MKKSKVEKSESIGLKTAEKIEIINKLQNLQIDDIQCGVGCCKPRSIQRLATKNIYLAVYCVVGLFMGMYFTYSVSTISTIEKRFKLTSKQTGVMLAGNDISQILLAMLVAYFGNYGNRPKWLGVGVLSAAFACFLSAVPHFVYGPGQEAIDQGISLSASHSSNASSSASGAHINGDKTETCHSPYVSDCGVNGTDTPHSHLGPLIILFIAQFFVGIAVSTFYSIGLVYLDDNVSKKDSPVYYAISMIVRVVGPVLGFFLGSKCLAIYIDPQYSPNIDLRDPRWLGAWWLGYLFLSILLVICGTFVLLFPRTLPTTLIKQMNHVRKKECPETPSISVNSDLLYYVGKAKERERHTKPSLKKLPFALKRLLTNKVWLGNNFNTVLTLFALMGYWSFKPKYLEYQFRKSASTANFYTGVASLVASILGLGISGIIIKIFRPGPRFISAYSCVLTVFSAASMFALMFVSCPRLNIIGPTTNSTLLSNCNSDCGCSDRYTPVCGADGVTVFHSPCYAGCTDINRNAAPVEYLNCKCVTSVILKNVSTDDQNQQQNIYQIEGTEPTSEKAVQGYCEDKCDSFFYYIAVTIFTKTIDSTGRIGGTLIYLRSVEEHDKGLALGVSTLLLSLFAFIPAPIVMGAIVDSACMIWDNTCGQQGNCWFYDSDQFRKIIHAVPAVIILISLLGDIMVFCNCKHLILYEDKEDKDHYHKDFDNQELQEELKEMRPLS